MDKSKNKDTAAHENMCPKANVVTDLYAMQSTQSWCNLFLILSEEAEEASKQEREAPYA